MHDNKYQRERALRQMLLLYVRAEREIVPVLCAPLRGESIRSCYIIEAAGVARPTSGKLQLPPRFFRA